MTSRLSPRIVLVIIAALFFLPLILAWLMYSGSIEFRPHSTRNLGQLVDPPLPLDWSGVRRVGANDEPFADIFAGHWLVLHAVPLPCTETCLEEVTDLRQIHRAAGRQQSRLRLALLQESDQPAVSRQLEDIYPVFVLLENPDRSLWHVLESVARQGEPAAPARGSTYLIDPLGNIMMFYSAGYDPNDLKKDLKRLLTWSKLDEQS